MPDDALLQKLQDNPSDVETLLVYADALQSSGDPRGELIALQNERRTAEAEALIAAQADHLLGRLKFYAPAAMDGSDRPVFQWRLGFIQAARLSYDSNEGDPGYEGDDLDDDELGELSLEDCLEHLLTHPSGALLTDLEVALNMLDDGCYFESICKLIGEHGAPALRRLEIGEYNFAGPRGPTGTDYDYEISWTAFGDMSSMWAGLPRLERLVLLGGMGDLGHPGSTTVGPVSLPRLQHLEVKTGGMASENARAFASASWPELRYLDLWFGDDGYGFTGGVDDVKPLLDATAVPKLTHLGLMNAQYTDALCAALPGSAVLGQLKELSLALGTMSDEGAKILAENAQAFSHLEMIDLEHNFLTPEGEERVRSLCPDVRLENQRERADWDLDGPLGGRFVAVSE